MNYSNDVVVYFVFRSRTTIQKTPKKSTDTTAVELRQPSVAGVLTFGARELTILHIKTAFNVNSVWVYRIVSTGGRTRNSEIHCDLLWCHAKVVVVYNSRLNASLSSMLSKWADNLIPTWTLGWCFCVRFINMKIADTDLSDHGPNSDKHGLNLSQTLAIFSSNTSSLAELFINFHNIRRVGP